MEIIIELLLQIFGFLFQILGEFLLQLVVEVIAELFGQRAKQTWQREMPVSAWRAAAGYAAIGAICGAISLWFVPILLLAGGGLRLANLLVTPVLVGALMGAMGAWRRRVGWARIRLDTFAFGFCFAFAMALVRFIWGG